MDRPRNGFNSERQERAVMGRTDNRRKDSRSRLVERKKSPPDAALGYAARPTRMHSFYVLTLHSTPKNRIC